MASSETNPERSDRIVRVLWWTFGWIIPLSALALMVILGFQGLSYSPLTWLGFLGCYLVSVVFHEFGHYFAGLQVGINPVLVSIGHGDLLFEKFAFNCTWRIHALGYSGYVLPFPLSRDRIRSQMLVCTAGGPLVNALIALLSFWFMHDPQLRYLQDSGKVDFEGLILNVFLANIFIFFSSLVTLFPAPEIEQDGALILKYLLGRVPVESGLDSATDVSKASMKPVKGWTIPHLLPVHRHIIHSKTSAEADMLNSLQGFSYIAAIYSLRYLREADGYSRRLLESRPGDWRAMGARGCVLVQLEAPTEGVPLLEAAFNAADVPFYRGIFGVFLAGAFAAKGDAQVSKHWLEIAKNADDQCVDFEGVTKQFAALAAKALDQKPRPPTISA